MAGSASIRTILVDDSRANLDALSSSLRRHPRFEVVGTAPSGEEGIRLFRELQPDLVLTDFSMPGMSGAALTRALKSVSDPPLVVVVSNHADQEYRDAAAAAGADGYALKSELDELFPLLQRITEAR